MNTSVDTGCILVISSLAHVTVPVVPDLLTVITMGLVYPEGTGFVAVLAS